MKLEINALKGSFSIELYHTSLINYFYILYMHQIKEKGRNEKEL